VGHRGLKVSAKLGRLIIINWIPVVTGMTGRFPGKRVTAVDASLGMIK
jgi:hypothetical protein